MKDYKMYNAENVLNNVNKCIDELTSAKATRNYDYSRIRRMGWMSSRLEFIIDSVYDELSIFDTWMKYLSMSQLKQMKSFLETAIKLGFTGYVCFKVGSVHCTHGMWAFTKESTNGFSPDGDTLFHSFRCDYNYWDMELNGVWMHEKYPSYDAEFSLKQIKDELRLERGC